MQKSLHPILYIALCVFQLSGVLYNNYISTPTITDIIIIKIIVKMYCLVTNVVKRLHSEFYKMAGASHEKKNTGF